MDNPLDALGPKCTFPYLHGVYLAVNAIPDAYLLVDAPVCAFTKAEQFYGTHDLLSTLVSTTSKHRIVHTRLHVDNAVDGNRKRYQATFRRLLDAPFARCVMVSAFPMGVVIGNPYAEWCDEVRLPTHPPVVHVPGKSLRSDWYEGYSDTLACLARDLPLPAAQRDPRKVAIVGLFMDRNEEDHRGNVRELRRLLEALDLELVTAWPSGDGVDALARVGEAGTIVALPWGARAAEILAQRTGATRVACDAPFGPEATWRWIRAVGAACGRAEQAEALVKAEAAEAGRLLEKMILKRLVHGRWAFAGDPHLMPGLCDLARYVGARVICLASWGIRPVPWPADAPEPPVPAGHNLNGATLQAALADRTAGTDLVIGNSELLRHGLLPEEMGFLEFGYPSPQTHELFDAPFLGTRGFVRFANRIGNLFKDQDLGDDANALFGDRRG